MIGDFLADPGLDQRVEPGDQDFGNRAPHHRLLVEQVGLAFLREGGCENSGTGAAQRLAVGEGDGFGIAAGILLDGIEGHHALPLEVERTKRRPGPLRSDHEYVEV